MNAEVGFNIGDEFFNVLGGSAMLPPGSVTLIGHPRGWNVKPLVYELVQRALHNAEAKPGSLKVMQLNAGDVDFLEDKALPSLFNNLEEGRLFGFTIDCSSILRPFGGKSVNKTIGKIRQAAATLQVPAIITLSFDRFLEPDDERLVALYDSGADAANNVDLELFLLGQSHHDNLHGWYLKAGKCRHLLTADQRRVGLNQKHKT